jgi:hypothetical protein
MVKQIERLPAVLARLGVKRTQFQEDYVLHDDADPYVPHSDETVLRVKPVPLGVRAIGFFSDEIDALIEALRRLRDHQAALPRARSARR